MCLETENKGRQLEEQPQVGFYRKNKKKKKDQALANFTATVAENNSKNLEIKLGWK